MNAVAVNSPSLDFLPARSKSPTEEAFTQMRVSSAALVRQEAAQNDDEIEFFVHCGNAAFSQIWSSYAKSRHLRTGLLAFGSFVSAGCLAVIVEGVWSILTGRVGEGGAVDLLMAMLLFTLSLVVLGFYLCEFGSPTWQLIRRGFTDSFSYPAQQAASNVVGVGRRSLNHQPCLRTVFLDAIGSVRCNTDANGSITLQVIDRSGDCVVHVPDAYSTNLNAAINAMENCAKR